MTDTLRETDFFYSYILAALHCSLRNVQAAGAIVPDAEREQAIGQITLRL